MTLSKRPVSLSLRFSLCRDGSSLLPSVGRPNEAAGTEPRDAMHLHTAGSHESGPCAVGGLPSQSSSLETMTMVPKVSDVL